MAQLMPLPLTISCFSKIQIGFTFLVPAHPGNPGQRAVKRMCVCVCVYLLGHVDAGKSTLMGHLLFQLGFVGKKAMHKFEQDSRKAGKGSFAYAWVLDETEEERHEKLYFVSPLLLAFTLFPLILTNSEF